MTFKGSGGTNLQVQGEVDLEVPSSALGNVDDDSNPGSSNPLSAIKAFYLSPSSGVWEPVASLVRGSKRRKKRQSPGYTVSIAGLSSDQQWLNFDAVARTTCLSKVRFFGSQEFSEGEQITGVQIYAFISGADGTYSYSTRLANNNDYNNGACIVHRCDSPRNQNSKVGFNGFLVAKKNGKHLVPAVNDTGLGDLETQLNYMAFSDKLKVNYDLTVVQDQKGPFYDYGSKWYESSQCVGAPFEEKHFRFHLQPEDQCYQTDENSQGTATCLAKHYLLWHSTPDIYGESYSTCYMRVEIGSPTNNVKVQVFSRVGTLDIFTNDINGIVQPGDTYAYQEDCTNQGVACVKVKPPGDRGCSTNPVTDKVEHDHFTGVTVRAWYKESRTGLNVSAIHTSLMSYDIQRNDTKFEFHWTSSSTIGGIYCVHNAKTPGESDVQAEELCLGGDEVAVHFGSEYAK